MISKVFLIAATILCSSIREINCQQANSVESVDLVDNWTIKNANRSIELKGLKIPISVHTALRRQNLIPEPYYRYNDVNIRWIALDENWVFENTIQIKDSTTLESNRIDLEFYSIDTVSTVYLNDKFILFTDNQFAKYSVENVNSNLKVGSNKLEIRFRSAVLYAKTLAGLYPYVVPPECWPATRHGECHANFIRKEQCSFGWDWGPAFATMAINEMITVKYINLFKVELSPTIHPASSGDLNNWIIANKLFISTVSWNTLTSALFEVKIEELGFYFNHSTTIYSTLNEVYVPVLISKSAYPIRLWFPNGYGEQKLYKVDFTLSFGNRVFRESQMLGFRSVQLVQEPMPGANNGLSFYLKINNIPIFLKGSNWIPADSFKDNVTDSYLEWLIFSAKDAHMNILRVWGGGVYEDERFYNLADKNGIMIWQDFMFACATYPTNSDFLLSVEKEVTTQVLRLRRHPSVVVWAGNNENEALVGTNWFGTDANRKLYEEDYRKLYIDLIRTTLLELDPVVSRPYLSSSPTNGAQSGVESSNWVSKNPYDLKYGDLHFYDYYINSWEPGSWPIPRLASEYGFQSFPSYSTLQKVYSVDDLDFYSDLNEHRQHRDSQEGNKEIEWQIMFHTKTAKLKNKAENFKLFIYLSQIYQAMSYKVYQELLRRNRDSYNEETGIGKSMGAMYWQFNDIWQAPTWSSLEYGGKWKMSHYYSKRSFAPLLISPNIDPIRRILNVHVVSDLPDQTVSDTIVVSVFSYENFKVKLVRNIDFTVGPLNTTNAYEWSFESIKSETGCEFNTSKSCLITFSFLKTPQYGDGDNSIFFNNFFHTVENLIEPKLEIINIEKIDLFNFNIRIKTSSIALFVWLDLATTEVVGRFENNGFHMTSQETDVKVYVQSPSVTVDFIRANLNVRSLVLYKEGNSNGAYSMFPSSKILNILLFSLIFSALLLE